MLDQIVDARRQSVGVNQHGRELRAESRQALAEALTEMLEFRVFEVRHSTSDCRSTQSEGHCCRPQIKEWQHHVEHGRKARGVIRKLKVGWDLALVQRNRRRGVGPKSQTFPRPRTSKAVCLGGKKIESGIGRSRPLRGKRRHDIALRMTGAGHPRFLGAYAHAVAIPMCAGNRRPEMTPRAGLTESESG